MKFVDSDDPVKLKYLKCDMIKENKVTTTTKPKKIPSKTDFRPSLTQHFQLPLNAGKKANNKKFKHKSVQFTEVYHNENPFYVEIMSKQSTRCSHCGIDIYLGELKFHLST